MGITSYPAPSSGGFPFSSQPPVGASSVLFDGQLVNSASATKTISGNGGSAYIYTSSSCSVTVGSTTYTTPPGMNVVKTNAFSGSVSATVGNNTTSAPTSWSLATTTFPTSVSSYSMFYGQGYYVMQNSNTGQILYSSDAVTWTYYTISGFNQVGKLGFDGTTWMYVGYVNSVGYCSATTTNITSAGSWNLNQNSTAGNSGIPVGDGNGNWQIMQPAYVWFTTNNGGTWSQLAIENLSGGAGINISTNGTYWILTQGDSSFTNTYIYVASSVSGPYTRITTFSGGSMGATFYANGLFMVWTNYGIAVSPTPNIASSWILTIPSSLAGIVNNFAYINGWYVTACGSNYLTYSPDGYTWTTALVASAGGGGSYFFSGITGPGNGTFAMIQSGTSGVGQSIWKSTNTYPSVPSAPIQFGIYAGPSSIQ